MPGQISILIVEDDPLIGADLCLTLSKFGYNTVGPVTSGENALEEVKKRPISFILMDITLQGKLDGIKTAEVVQTIRPTPVVFLSALSDESTLQRAKLVNPFGYLIKPFDPAELRATIELTLQRFSKETSEPTKSDANDTEGSPEPYSEGGPTGDQILHYLRQFAAFKNFSAETLHQLSSNSSLKEFEAGEFLVHEGEESDGVFISCAGRISVTKTAESGKELIVALLAPGDPFGLIYTLPAFKRTTSVKTQIASKVIWIAASHWQRFCETNPKMYHNMADILANRLAASHSLSSSLAHSKVEQRIINALITLSADFGKFSSEHLKQSRIYITRKELSELTGTTPETAIRVTKNLEREGILDLTRPGIIKILDIGALQTAAG